MKLKLRATSDDMDALHRAVDKRGKLAHVDKAMLDRVIKDHAQLLQQLRPEQVEV